MTDIVNAYLFRGEIRGYWRLRARGADRASIVLYRHRHRGYDFGRDDQGMAKRNGGILNPAERTLGSRQYLYRFVDTRAYTRNRHDTMAGNWWLDEDTWRLLRDAARAGGDKLQTVAQNYLALPDEWGDRGRIARGRLSTQVMVWSGNGLAVQASNGRHTPAQHNKAVQLFIPGEPELVGLAFGGANHLESCWTQDCPASW